jgi:hypothetical protein
LPCAGGHWTPPLRPRPGWPRVPLFSRERGASGGRAARVFRMGALYDLDIAAAGELGRVSSAMPVEAPKLWGPEQGGTRPRNLRAAGRSASRGRGHAPCRPSCREDGRAQAGEGGDPAAAMDGGPPGRPNRGPSRRALPRGVGDGPFQIRKPRETDQRPLLALLCAYTCDAMRGRARRGACGERGAGRGPPCWCAS